MQPEFKDSEIVLAVSEQLGDFPASLSAIQEAINKARETNKKLSAMSQKQIRDIVIVSNLKMIQWQFLDTMHRVLRKIQPQIKHYPQHKSIQYLQSIIYEHLDPTIFSTVRISKIRNTLLGDTLSSQHMTMTDKLFTQLLTVMNELLQLMKQYYGFPRDQKISGVVFQCINMFVQENQNCFLVQLDKKLSESEEQKQKKKTKDPLISTLYEINKDAKEEKARKKSGSHLRIAETLIVNVFSQLKNKVNVFGNKQEQQKKMQETKTILKKYENISKRETLNEQTIKVVLRLRAMESLEIIKTMDNSQKAEFTSILFDSLESISKLNSSKLSKMKHIEKQICEMLEAAIDSNGSCVDEQLQKNKQIKWITLLYKALQKEYHIDSERRKWLLKFCENEYISKRLHNPYAVIKILESQKMQESQVHKALRNLPLAQKVDPAKKKQQNKKQIDAHLALEHQLNRIHLYELKKKYAKQPNLEFQRLTDSKKRVVTFLFSGFLSQDTDKVEEWSGLLNNFYDSQVYSVRWESKSVKNMTQFVLKSVTDLGPTQSIAMLGGPYVKAFAIVHNLYQKFQENPFNPAFESAISTGQFMAEFIMNNFKGYFINLVGFSLGTELIKNIMSRMAQKNSLNMLNTVYLLGGVADKTSMQKLIQSSACPLSIVNLYSDNDYILKYLLRICKTDITPVGLNAIKHIDGHTIKNEDCTYFVGGHLSYRANLQFFAKYLKIADD